MDKTENETKTTKTGLSTIIIAGHDAPNSRFDYDKTIGLVGPAQYGSNISPKT